MQNKHISALVTTSASKQQFKAKPWCLPAVLLFVFVQTATLSAGVIHSAGVATAHYVGVIMLTPSIAIELARAAGIPVGKTPVNTYMVTAAQLGELIQRAYEFGVVDYVPHYDAHGQRKNPVTGEGAPADDRMLPPCERGDCMRATNPITCLGCQHRTPLDVVNNQLA